MVICYVPPRKLIQGAWQIHLCGPDSCSSHISSGNAFSEKWFNKRETAGCSGLEARKVSLKYDLLDGSFYVLAVELALKTRPLV